MTVYFHIFTDTFGELFSNGKYIVLAGSVMGLVTLNRDGLISNGAKPPGWFFL